MKSRQKKQVVVIHGGDPHNTYEEFITSLKAETLDRDDLVASESKSWRSKLPRSLGSSYEIFAPDMPNAMNAKYLEWSIWFEKILPHLHERPVFVGHSLGAIFLAQYFCLNKDAKNMAGMILVAPPYIDETSKEKLADFVLPQGLRGLSELGEKVHIYFSQDDPIVEFSNMRGFEAALKNAKFKVFKDKGHFRGEKLPEIVKDIKSMFTRTSKLR